MSEIKEQMVPASIEVNSTVTDDTITPVTKTLEVIPAKLKELPRPRGVSEALGVQLVVKFKAAPYSVWHNFRMVLRPRQNEKNVYDIRVFDNNQAVAKKVNIENYISLDAHPDLILYEGWMEKRMWLRIPKIEIVEKK